jgi:hypothetical protein
MFTCGPTAIEKLPRPPVRLEILVISRNTSGKSSVTSVLVALELKCVAGVST